MALALAFGSAQATTGAHNSVAFNVNIAAGEGLLVAIGARSSTLRTISSVTVNSDALTVVTGGTVTNEYASGLYHMVHWYYLADPDDGLVELAVTFSGNVNSSAIMWAELTGIDGADPVGAANTASGSGTTPAVTLTTEDDNSWVLGASVMRRADGGSYTAGTDATEITEGETGSAAQSDITFWIGYEPKATAGSVTIDTTNATSSAQWSMAAVEVKEAFVEPPEGAIGSPLASRIFGAIIE